MKICDEDLQKIMKMREILNDEFEKVKKFQEISSNFRLFRFLLDAGGSIEKASENYKNFLKWREENKVNEIRENIDQISYEQIENFQKICYHLPVNLLLRHSDDDPSDFASLLFDKAGRPISIERTGLVNIPGLLGEISDDEMIRMHISNMEKRSIILDRLSEERGELVQITLIKDFAGLDVRELVTHPRRLSVLLSRVRTLLSLARDYYPQSTGIVILLHTPWVFEKIFPMVTSVLRKEHLNITRVLSNVEQLCEYFDEGSLPAVLGGNCVSKYAQLPDGHLSDRFAIGPGKEQMEVANGKSLQIPFNVKPGDRVSWAVGIENLDILFGVQIRTQSDGMAWLMELQKLTSVRCVRGECKTATSGTVVLVFDNSKSWIRSKVVNFKFEITSAKEQAGLDDIVKPENM